MNSKIRFVEILFMILVIVSFAVTGIMIMMGYDDYSIVSLAVTAFFVLTEFYLVLAGSAGRVLDLSRTGMRGKQGGTYAGNAYGEDAYGYDDLDNLGEVGSFVGEGVGNMRVYKRGEKINFTDSDE